MASLFGGSLAIFPNSEKDSQAMRFSQKQNVCPRAVARARGGFTLIELLVVMGIAALLMTLAATSFFGASRRDNITKSRDQFCDVLRLARQQASVLGKTHVVVCWNAKTKITVGDRQIAGGEQGRYALFEYIGNVWPDGDKLAAPFGIQREALGSLTKNARLININDPDKEFMRVKHVANDATQTKEDREDDEESVTKVQLDYYVGGQQHSIDLRGENLWVATLRKSSGESKPFPLGVRASQTYSLPKDYAFNKDRSVFIFTADGQLASGSESSVTAKHSVSKNADNATFTVTVNQQGDISKK